MDIELVGELKVKPPVPPRNVSSLSIMLWSLKLRYCVWKHGDYHGLEDATIYVFYFNPKQSSGLAHSLGLQKSLIGVVNAFASKKMKKENHVIIAHELLDMVGAADKYDYSTN